MRLHEIEDKKRNEIEELYAKYFEGNAEIEIEDDGSISSQGDIVLSNYYKHAVLPVKFKDVFGSIYITDNTLKSLEGSPEFVDENFNCWDNQLISLEGGPRRVEGNYYCYNNRTLTSLKGLPDYIGGGLLLSYHTDLPLLDICLIPYVKKVGIMSRDPNKNLIKDILNRHINKGRKGAIQCAAELTQAGFKGNARR